MKTTMPEENTHATHSERGSGEIRYVSSYGTGCMKLCWLRNFMRIKYQSDAACRISRNFSCRNKTIAHIGRQWPGLDLTQGIPEVDVIPSCCGESAMVCAGCVRPCETDVRANCASAACMTADCRPGIRSWRCETRDAWRPWTLARDNRAFVRQ